MIKIEKANAYSALIGAVAGTLGTIIVAAFFIGGQWQRWTEIRDAHIADQLVNANVDLTGYLTADDLPDLSGYALKNDIPSTANFLTAEDLPDISNLALKAEIPSLASFALKRDIPDIEKFAKKSDIPDVASFVSVTDFNALKSTIGTGETDHPAAGSTTSRLCDEGFAMVGVKYVVVDGRNAGALYHGLYPVCRKLVR